jgi:hypothetical protein
MNDLNEAKIALVEASDKRDQALERWPVNAASFAISGMLSFNTYARDWQQHDAKIKQILTLYPELDQ